MGVLGDAPGGIHRPGGRLQRHEHDEEDEPSQHDASVIHTLRCSGPEWPVDVSIR